MSGSIAFGQVTGSVRGSIDNAGNLSLQGSASNGQITLALTSFNVSISGTSMTGNVTYNAGLAGVPGVAVITSRLSGVTRRQADGRRPTRMCAISSRVYWPRL